jgi:hypothetical protein
VPQANLLRQSVKRFIQLSAPSQATTLIAVAFMSAFQLRGAGGRDKVDACSLEWFNPDCHSSRMRHLHNKSLHQSLLACFGAGGIKQVVEKRSLWLHCASETFADLLRRFQDSKATFAKENFGG